MMFLNKIIFIAIIDTVASGCSNNRTTTHIKEQNIPTSAIPITLTAAVNQFTFKFGPKDVQDIRFIKADFTCDGIQDVALSINDLKHFQGANFQVMLVTGHAGKVKNSSELMWYEALSKTTGKGLKSLLKGDGSNVPTLTMREIGVAELRKVAKSEFSCNKVVVVKQKDEQGHLFFFDNVTDYFSKKKSYAIRRGKEAGAGSGGEITDIKSTHML